MFTDRFIKLPVEFVKDGNENLGTDEEVIPNCFFMVNPHEITAYRKHHSNETGLYKCNAPFL